MEKYLITMTLLERVEVADVQRATAHCWEEKHALVVLGTKGSRTTFFGKEQMAKYNHEQWRKVAEMGLLYVQKLDGAERQAFAPSVDEHGLPVLLVDYAYAFAMRSKEGVKPEPPKVEQTEMALKS